MIVPLDSAQQQLVEHYWSLFNVPLFKHVSRKPFLNSQDCEDIVQVSFQELVLKFPEQGQDETKVWGLLCRVAKCRSVDLFRKRTVRRCTHFDERVVYSSSLCTERSYLETSIFIIADHLETKLRNSSLVDVFRLKCMGLSHQEMCVELGISRRTLFRRFKDLSERLKAVEELLELPMLQSVEHG
jgi:DNA-directed RNA polymerase specialized sigma24 family protein